MLTKKDRQRFERMMLPHLDASYNLARWLVHNPEDAEDIVQMAYIKAFESFSNYKTGNSAGWILTIVRNTTFTWLDKQKRTSNLISFNEATHSQQARDSKPLTAITSADPEALASQAEDKATLINAIDNLPIEFREALLLRDIEGWSYKEIAEITNVPKGTVMSRLSRARKSLQEYLMKKVKREHASGL